MKRDGIYWAPTGVGPAQTFRLRSLERFEGIKVEVAEGVGTPDDIYRVCTYWFDDNGLLIAHYDPTDTIDTGRGINDGDMS